MTVRRMKVVRSPGSETRPEIRISNSWLFPAGFGVGTPIEVTYQKDKIIIRKLEDKHESNFLQGQPAGPIPIPTNSVCAKESA